MTTKPVGGAGRKRKRTWVYVQRPKQYDIALHGCGHADPDWSEYKGHLWCPACKVDFVPEHGGIFEGPIPVNASIAFGLCFDRFNLKTKQVEPFAIAATETSRRVEKRKGKP